MFRFSLSCFGLSHWRLLLSLSHLIELLKPPWLGTIIYVYFSPIMFLCHGIYFHFLGISAEVVNKVKKWQVQLGNLMLITNSMDITKDGALIT